MSINRNCYYEKTSDLLQKQSFTLAFLLSTLVKMMDMEGVYRMNDLA